MASYNNQTEKLAPQFVLQQRYVIVQQIGQGGMGTVYLAMDNRVAQRYVAIKEMSQSKLSTEELPGATVRFQQEAAMLGKLSHPNLPHIYDAFSERGRSYLVMDYIHGKTLQQILREKSGQPLPIAQVLFYARQLCEVLAYLHQQNPPIIFRDVKPSNIMIAENDRVVLIDFGIARLFKEGQEQDTLLLGSPGYAPPEQHGLTQTSQRADIYSLGVTLHYCLSGRDPYYTKEAFSFPKLRQINPQVPNDLDELIQRMVAHDELARPANAREVQQALLAISQRANEFTNALDAGQAATLYGSPAITSGNQKAAEAQAPTVAVNQKAISAQAPTMAVSQAQIPQGSRVVPPGGQPFPFSSTSTNPIWSKGFITSFAIMLAVSLAGSIFALSVFFGSTNIEYGWAFVVESCLALLLLLVAAVSWLMLDGRGARTILIITGIAALLLGLATLGRGSIDVQQMLNSLLPTSTPYLNILDTLLTVGIVGAALVSCGWLLHSSGRIGRMLLLIFLGLAIICAILQAFFSAADVFRHALLLVTLIALILGNMLAVRMERVRDVPSRPDTAVV